MRFDTITDNFKNFKLICIVAIICTVLPVPLFTQQAPASVGVTSRISRETILTMRSAWIHPGFSANGNLPDYPLPGRNGGIVPSVDDILLILGRINAGQGGKVLFTGPLAGYFGQVYSVLGIPVWVIESGIEERAIIKRFSRQAGNSHIQVADTDSHAAFRFEAPFDVIVMTGANSEVPNEIFHQLSYNGGRMLAVLTEKTGSQLLVEYRQTRTQRSIICVGRVTFSQVIKR